MRITDAHCFHTLSSIENFKILGILFYNHTNQIRYSCGFWLVRRRAPLPGGPLGFSNLGWWRFFFGCNSSITNSSVNSSPFSTSIWSFIDYSNSVNKVNNERKSAPIYFFVNCDEKFVLNQICDRSFTTRVEHPLTNRACVARHRIDKNWWK